MQPVLIVEDNTDLQDIYKIAFNNASIPIEIRSNGLDALAEVKKMKPSLILLDILMPDINGIKFLELVNNTNVMNVPVIVCSNLSDKETMDKCKELGVIDYIVKADVDISDIVKRVKQFFDTGK